jgi:hypothetical protein
LQLTGVAVVQSLQYCISPSTGEASRVAKLLGDSLRLVVSERVWPEALLMFGVENVGLEF